MKRYSVTIEGVTPMICNRFTEDAQMAATNGSRINAIAGDKGSPREIAEPKLYKGKDDKTLVLPGPNLFACIIEAGKFFKAGKSKVTTIKSSLIPACVAVEEIEMPIEHKEAWEVDTRPVCNPSTGGRFLCHRPKFNDWKVSFHLELDEEFMDGKLLRDIVDTAGKRVGLGDFRPARKGPFGKFVVTNWKEI